MSDRTRVVIGAAMVLLLAIFCALRLKVRTDITHFLPSTGDRELAEIARQLVDSTLTRTMILSIEAKDAEQAIAAARALAEKLRANPEVASLRNGVAEDEFEAYYRLFFPHRLAMLSEDPERELPQRLSDAGLAAAAQELKRQLSLPMAPLVARLAGADPLLSFPAQLKRLQTSQRGPLTVQDGQFVTTDGRHAILFLASKSAPFDSEKQAPLLAAIDSAFAAINTAHGGALRLEKSGVNRFAVDAERVIRADMSRISTFSTIALVLLFVAFFRSLRALALSFLPLVAGFVAATAAGIVIFGGLHGITLAFGSTLIGVAVDYPILFLNQHALAPATNGPWATLARVRGALLLGASTTVAGFAGLAWTSFPGIREIAVFATVGILAALAATFWFLPALSLAKPTPTLLHRRAADRLARTLRTLSRWRRPLLLIPVAAVVACALGWSRLSWSDDPSVLTPINARLLAEDDRVRAQVSRMDGGRLVITVAEDDAAALEQNDRVYARLVTARRDGLLEDFSSAHDILFSEDLQRRNLAQVANVLNLGTRTVSALEQAGFRASGFTAFLAASTDLPKALSASELLRSPLGDLLRPFRADLGGRVGIITLLRGVRDAVALESRLAGLPGVHFFDQQGMLAAVYASARTRTQTLLVVGVLVVFLLLFARYRRVGFTLAAGLPALLAAATTLALLALSGVQTNLLHVVSLLLVLSMGEDYAIFLLAARDVRDQPAAAMSVAMCCLTAVASFGLLAMSEIPALRAIGLTTGLGILLSFVLAPTALALLPHETES